MAAVGISDGDRRRLEWVPSDQPRLRRLAPHDVATRECAYDAKSHVCTSSDSLMARAKAWGWTEISMQTNWNRIFASE